MLYFMSGFLDGTLFSVEVGTVQDLVGVLARSVVAEVRV